MKMKKEKEKKKEIKIDATKWANISQSLAASSSGHGEIKF